MIAAKGILTARGGKIFYAAVVARGMGKPCVCGTEGVLIDMESRTLTVDGLALREGDLVSIDGSTGAVYAGEVPVMHSEVVRYLDGELPATHSPLLRAVERMLAHADKTARLRVHANADTPEDAARARSYGATGIGLCRTEHMFLGARRELVERLILASDDHEQDAALAELQPLQRADVTEILQAMDGLPVTIRLIDPPLHEFLPPLEELSSRVATARALGKDPGHDEVLLAAVRRIHESNPMLGLRGVRLGLVIPGLFTMQATAIAEAAAEVAAAGGNPRPEIMVPLVGSHRELEMARQEVEEALAKVEGAPKIPIGTMIEVPRAALTADRIAAHAEFFSFGTNDLTQMTWGFSRDDVEGSFFPRYLDLGVFQTSPFESLDRGVAQLIDLAVKQGRATRPDLVLGVCGEHGGDPASIHAFHDLDLDYVSCSPFRVPVARLEAGRAAAKRLAHGSDTR
jgi:pyruvate,orthophosphate dikinase